MLVVLENTYLEEMVGNGYPDFCILETNTLVLNFFPQDLVNGFHLCSKYQVFIIHREYYFTFQSWLLLIGGSSNFHCALVKRLDLLTIKP